MVFSQSVYLTSTHAVYKYLDKMEAKQIITGYRDAVKPLSREAIAKFIIQIDTTSMNLTAVEQEQQFFYKEEFYQELENLGYENIIEERWHLYQYKSDPGNLNVDLIGGHAYYDRADGKFTNITSNGMNAYGYLGKHVGLYFMYRDNSESGSFMSASRPLSDMPAQVISKATPSFLNYGPIDAQVNLDFSFVSFSIEKMHNTWGAGERGNIILSNKAPSYPQIKMRARFAENIDFTYLHGWLHSDIVDTLRSYQVPNVPGFTGFRKVYRQKYIAAHMIEITPWNGIDIALGESQIYGSRSPEVLYLIPVMFFKAAEHWMYDTDNSQMFLTMDLNVIKNHNYYLSLFIDEFSIADFGRLDRQRNQLGFTVGSNIYDVVIEDTKLMVEYTRMNPWVYNHRFSDATFQSHKINLGHWIGQNADLFSVSLFYRPMFNLEVGVLYESLRKGGKDSTIFQYRIPSSDFLYDPLTKQQTYGLLGTYEPMRDVMIDFKILRSNFSTQVTPTSFDYIENPNEYHITPSYSGKWDIFVGLRYNFD